MGSAFSAFEASYCTCTATITRLRWDDVAEFGGRHSLSQLLLFLVAGIHSPAPGSERPTTTRRFHFLLPNPCVIWVTAVQSGVTSGWQRFVPFGTSICFSIRFSVVCSFYSQVGTLVYSTPWGVCGLILSALLCGLLPALLSPESSGSWF